MNITGRVALYCYGLLLVASLLGCHAASAQDSAVTLSASPDNCVSLRKGQTCYQRVTLRWQAAITDDYCLNSSVHNRPLKCWDQARAGSASHHLKVTEDTTFSVVLKHDPQILASATVTVSWVYRSRSTRRRSWRLF